MAIEVGRLVVGVTADTSDAQKQIENELPKAGDTAGKKTSSVLGTALKGGALVAGGAMAAILGASLVKGFNRLSAIDQATHKLSGLGHSAEEVQKIMDNALASVKGTAFGLDEAATLSASAVAAGIQPGKQLTRQLTLIADTATIAGTSMTDLGDVFGDMYAKGNVTGETISRLQERGIPALQFLSKQFGWTMAEAAGKLKGGEVSIAQFTKAMESGLGGAAQKSGETFMGSLKNVGAAMSRFGAAVLGPVFKAMPKLFGNVTDAIDGVTPMAGKLGEAFGDLLSDIVPFIRQGLEALPRILPTVIGAFTSLVNVLRSVIGVVADVVSWMVDNRDVLMPIAGVILAMVGAWKSYIFVSTVLVPAVQAARAAIMGVNVALAANPIGMIVMAIAGLIAIFVVLFQKNEGFRNFVLGVWEKIKAVAMAVWPYIKQTIETVFNAVKQAAEIVWPIIQKIIQVVWTAISWWVEHYVKAVWAVISTVWDWIKTGVETVWPIIKNIIVGAWEAIKWYVTTYINVVKTVITTAWDFIKAATEFSWSLIKTLIINPIRTVNDVIQTVIGAVRDWLSSTWTAIKDRTSSAWQNIKDAVLNPLHTARDTVHMIFENLGTWLDTTWTAVKTAASNAWNNVKNAITSPISEVWTFIKNTLGITDSGDIASSGPLHTLVNVWGKVVDGIGKAFDGVKAAIAAPIREAFEWVNANIITPINQKILDKFNAPNLPLLPDIPRMATGGWVRGRGGPTDDENLTWLSDGEFVVKAREANRNKSLLEQINNGQPITSGPSQGSVPLLQMGAGGFNPGDWLKDLWDKGAGGAVRALTSPGMDVLKDKFGGTFAGDLIIGAMDSVFETIAKVGDKLQMAPSALMEALYQYMKGIEGHTGYFHECLATIHAALDSLQSRFGFTTGGLISGSPHPNAIIDALGSGTFNKTDPPRGGLVFWKLSGYGHIAVATGKGNESINNWGGDSIEVVDNIGSPGYVGWLPPERFVSKFDSGGMLQPGWTMAFNDTGKPEPVFTAQQFKELSQNSNSGRTVVNNWNVQAREAPAEDAVMTAWRRWEVLQGV